MASHDKREETRQRTLKTADQHRQPWTHNHDRIVLTRVVQGQVRSDEDIAVLIGRTQLAVSQRRVVLNRLIDAGYTIEDIHEVERFNRAQRNSVRMRVITDIMTATCGECFCSPHMTWCSHAD